MRAVRSPDCRSALIAMFGATLLITSCGRAPALSPGATPGTASTPVVVSPTATQPTPTPASYRQPDVRYFPALGRDPVSGRAFLFGGQVPGTSALLDDLYSFDGRGWIQQDTNVSRPPATSGGVIATDPGRRVAVLVGGQSANGGRSNTWRFDGSQWQATALLPLAYADESLVACYDPATKSMYLFGATKLGSGGETFVLGWSGSSWTRLDGAGVRPAPRQGAALAYDPKSKSVVLFGGSTQNGPPGDQSDTWSWDGVAWKQLTTTVLPTAGKALAATDEARGEVVMVSIDGRTWRWIGSDWTPVTTTHSPGGHLFAVMGFDPASNRVILTAGKVIGPPPSYRESAEGFTWVWDGLAWSHL